MTGFYYFSLIFYNLSSFDSIKLSFLIFFRINKCVICRFPKNTHYKSGRNHEDKLENRDQAPKRQKLEGGHKRELRVSTLAMNFKFKLCFLNNRFKRNLVVLSIFFSFVSKGIRCYSRSLSSLYSLLLQVYNNYQLVENWAVVLSNLIPSFL